MTYDVWMALPKVDWFSEPISCTCQVALEYGKNSRGTTIVTRECGSPTAKVYPATKSGWMALCAGHAMKHTEAFDVYEVIAKGERFA